MSKKKDFLNRRRGGGVSNVLLARRPAKAAFRRRPAQCSSVLASWPDDAFVRRMPAAFGNEMPLVVVGLEYVGSAAFFPFPAFCSPCPDAVSVFFFGYLSFVWYTDALFVAQNSRALTCTSRRTVDPSIRRIRAKIHRHQLWLAG